MWQDCVPARLNRIDLVGEEQERQPPAGLADPDVGSSVIRASNPAVVLVEAHTAAETYLRWTLGPDLPSEEVGYRSICRQSFTFLRRPEPWYVTGARISWDISDTARTGATDFSFTIGRRKKASSKSSARLNFSRRPL